MCTTFDHKNRRDDHNSNVIDLVCTTAYCRDASLAIYDGFESLEFDPKKPKQYCGDLTYYKNVEDKVLLSTSNRLLIRYDLLFIG